MGRLPIPSSLLPCLVFDIHLTMASLKRYFVDANQCKRQSSHLHLKEGSSISNRRDQLLPIFHLPTRAHASLVNRDRYSIWTLDHMNIIQAGSLAKRKSKTLLEPWDQQLFGQQFDSEAPHALLTCQAHLLQLRTITMLMNLVGGP
jgi:hypothetical protein